MERKIIKTISNMGELNIEELKLLEILALKYKIHCRAKSIFEDRKNLIDSYKEKFKGFNGIKALDGPFLDLKPSSPDKDIMEVRYKKYLYTLKAARELDMDYLISLIAKLTHI